MHRGITWIIENSEQYNSSVELYSLYSKYTQEFGDVSIETFKRYCRDAAKLIYNNVDSEEKTYIKNKSETQNDISLDIVSYDLQTKEQLLEFANIDLDIWDVDKYVISRWGNPEQPQYQLKCWLKRKKHINIEDFSKIIDNLINSKQIQKVCYNDIQVNSKISAENYMAEIGLADFHFGLQARKEETGQDSYNIEIATNLMMESVDYYINRLKGRCVDAILLPVIGDFFNSDFNNSTTKGTPQDEATTYKETFQKAQELAIIITEKFKKIAPTKWIICEGNHDQYKSFYFNEFLRAWFKDDSRVIVDNSLTKRKFHVWKNNLFMYTHGDTEKFDMLPLRMAQSKKKEFAECDFYYIGVGHLHHKSNGIVRTSIDNNGIEVNVLPSLVSSSKWESNKWYQHIKECVCNIYSTNGKEETLFYHPTAIN